jgi:putative transposase
MNKTLNLEFGEYYHIFNRGNNYELIFLEERNYSYFLNLCKKHILPISDLYVYCLLPNHFHLLLRIKTEQELSGYQNEINLLKEQENEHLFISRKFSNFFNAYTKALNNGYNRRGSLFQERFGRIKIDNDDYFTSLIYYIHTNPLKHKITDNFKDYPYSSYKKIVNNEESFIQKDKILNWFGGLNGFIEFHNSGIEGKSIDKLILEE